jgi:hypothetical protein
MGAVYNTSAKLNIAAGYSVRVQEIKADCGAHNVNNGIKRTHFVERHILNRRVVNLRLGFGYPSKNVQCAGFCAFGNVRSRNEEAYILPSPVNVARMIVRVIMCAIRRAVRMAIVSAVMAAMLSSMMAVTLLVIGDMARIAAQVHYSVESGYSAPSLLDKIQLPAVKLELGEFRFEIFGINAEINQSAHGHIAGNAGETVKMQCFHLYFPCFPTENSIKLFLITTRG